MNFKTGFFSFLLILLSITSYAQEDFYIIEEASDRFKEIENYFLEYDPDTIVSLCQAFLQNDINEKEKGIAYFYQAQAEASIYNDGISLNSFDQAIDLFRDIQFDKGLAMAYLKKQMFIFF